MLTFDEICMREAIKVAKQAAAQDEVPVGAVITHKNQIIAKAHNHVELLKDPTAHAEIIAITQAANALGRKWLEDCCLYVTIEPCAMCAGAIVLARFARVCFGAADPKAGACGSLLNILTHKGLNHHPEVTSGVYETECGLLLTDFFKNKRASGKK